MIATIVDTTALLKLIVASLAAGIAVAVVFSLVVLGATRSSDLRRTGRSGAATGYAVLAAACGLLSAAIVVYGIYLVAHK